MPYANSTEQREYQKRWIAKNRSEFLEGKSCDVCGSTEELEIDHIDPSEKVSHRIWSWSKARREAELAKCRVVCKSHHFEKTVSNHERSHGEQHFNARLTEEDVEEIKRRRAAGMSLEEAGAPFGLEKGYVSKIVRGLAWRHTGH